MQGRITKVLNMKPQEILAMIEEAAGTRMFEDRREKAFKTMAKKEMKVQEITALLQEEIDPKLEKLRQEKRAFLDFQQAQSDLERMTKLVVAYDYIRSREKTKQADEELQTKQQRVNDLEETAVRLNNEIRYLQEDIKKVKTARDKELRKGGKFQALEDEVKTHSHELVRISTVIDLKSPAIDEEQQKLLASQTSVQELEKQLEAKTQEQQKAQQDFDSANAELQSQRAELEKKEELLSTLQTGVASKEGEGGGYQGQLSEAKQRMTSASTQQEQAKLKISHLEKRIKEDEPRARKAKEQNAGLLKELESLKSHAKKTEAQLNRLGFDSEKEDANLKEEATLQNNIRELQDQADAIKRKVSNIDFSYSDPSPGFDRSKVKGLVANLFTLDKRHSHAGTALEICAGGRLYNVVVDTAETGTQLLQNGKLKKRVTIIPLNKIAAFKASVERIGAAQKLAPGKVDLALSLVGHDDEVTAAMEYVFGSTLVCADAETAKQVTFDPSVRMKSVTLEGDIYDPAGTLSGGSAPQSSGVLVTLQKLNEIMKSLETAVRSLVQLQATMAKEKQKTDAAYKLKQELDLKTHEITLTEEQINSNSASSILQTVEQMKEQITAAKHDIDEAKTRYAEASKEVKQIENDMGEFKSNRGSKLAQLQKDLQKLKKEVSETSSTTKPLQQSAREAKMEAEQCGSDLAAARESVDECNETIKALADELEQLSSEHAKVKDAHDMAQAHLDDERAKLTGFDEELKSLEDASSSKTAQIAEDGLEVQKLGHQVEKLLKDRQAASQLLTSMEKEHDWIEDEKNSFGKAGTPYDFKGQNMAECKSSLKTVTDRLQGMKKKINPKVMNMIDSVEKKEVSLKNMMRTVIRDKKKIEETIENLDEYKREALQRTWSKVNGDFGQIFAELLPGSFAKLDPLEGKSINEGLEVKVSLGKVWKQSLTELSGGQRYVTAFLTCAINDAYPDSPTSILYCISLRQETPRTHVSAIDLPDSGVCLELRADYLGWHILGELPHRYIMLKHRAKSPFHIWNGTCNLFCRVSSPSTGPCYSSLYHFKLLIAGIFRLQAGFATTMALTVRPQIAHRPLAHHGAPPVQARAHVHPRRS